MEIEKLKKKSRAYALKNALAHDGKAIIGAVISSLFVEGLKKEDLKKFIKIINEIVEEINSLNLEEQKSEFENLQNQVHEREVREGLPELPNAKNGKVVMRFAPAPSGALHIGHAVSNVISSLFVKKYGGKFFVRIEDTNPEKIDLDSYKSFKEDCDWLFGNVEDYIILSDRIKIYYNYAEKLIKKNSAYVCTYDAEDFKKNSEEKIPCDCRKKTIKENKIDWKKMLDKKGFKEGEAVLRFKTPETFGGFSNPNPAMRDFPLARINLTSHPRQKNKFRVWPLMNLAVPVDDIELKMTHIIRGKDHMDNAKRQKMFYQVLGLEKKFPWTFFMGRIKFTDLKLGKRHIKAGIESGEFSGWDDEKLPTLVSLRKRGYKPEAFWKFAEQRGLTDVDKVISQKDFFEVLDRFNKG